MKERSEDSQRAIEASRSGMCLSTNTFDVVTKDGKRVRARIARRANRDYCYVFAGMPSTEIPHLYPSSSDIDRVRQWEAF